MLKISKILLSLLTLYITVKCGEFVFTDLIYSIGFSLFSWDFLMWLVMISVSGFGIVTLIYHYKTYFVLNHSDNHVKAPFEPEIAKIYWNGAKGFVISVVALMIMAIGFNISEGTLGSSFLGIILVLGLVVWMQYDILKTTSIYKDAIRPDESILDEIGKEWKD